VLCIEASADVDADAALTVRSVPLAHVSSPQLASSIVEYVARVKEPVLHADVANDPQFARDPYIALRRPLSVLCVPLLAHGRLSGVLYLENNRLRGAFTPARFELLRVLSAQAAIALENAMLYEDLERAHLHQVRVSQAQSRFVPVEFLRSLNRESILDVALGDNVRKEMSILFSDVRDFTALVEQMSPDQHIPFINGYLGLMEPAVLQHGGYIDSYIGDAIMALFEGEADHAVRAAIAMSEALQRFNQLRAESGRSPIGMGVGISTGELTLGTIGGSARIKCGVIGDAVNLAARVESLTKQLGAFLLITDHVRQGLSHPGQFELRLVDHVRVKGRAAPIRLFEVLDTEPPQRREARRKASRGFDEAMNLYSCGQFSEAARLFGECLAADATDGAALCLKARCNRYQAEPPHHWDGVTILNEK
jgi:class 3 adenylate cyclase